MRFENTSAAVAAAQAAFVAWRGVSAYKREGIIRAATAHVRTQADRIGPLDRAFGEREVIQAQKEHRAGTQQQHCPKPARVVDPEERAPVEQHVAQGAAAKRRDTGHDADTDRIHSGARRGQQAG